MQCIGVEVWRCGGGGNVVIPVHCGVEPGASLVTS